MTPSVIKGHAATMRKRVTRLKETVGYNNFKPLQEVFSLADDLCELVIALAENQEQWLGDQQAQHKEPKE